MRLCHCKPDSFSIMRVIRRGRDSMMTAPSRFSLPFTWGGEARRVCRKLRGSCRDADSHSFCFSPKSGASQHHFISIQLHRRRFASLHSWHYECSQTRSTTSLQNSAIAHQRTTEIDLASFRNPFDNVRTKERTLWRNPSFANKFILQPPLVRSQ